MITKHLDSNTKCPKVLFYYDFVQKVIGEEENVLLVAKLDYFAINTISLQELEILATMIVDAKINIDAKIGTVEKIHINANIGTNAKIGTNPKISTNTKIGTIWKLILTNQFFYFPRTLEEILVDIMPTWIKV